MAVNQWSPEPWAVSPVEQIAEISSAGRDAVRIYVVDRDGIAILSTVFERGKNEVEVRADVARLVACVNALAVRGEGHEST